jgi:hypothetical protein
MSGATVGLGMGIMLLGIFGVAYGWLVAMPEEHEKAKSLKDKYTEAAHAYLDTNTDRFAGDRDLDLEQRVKVLSDGHAITIEEAATVELMKEKYEEQRTEMSKTFHALPIVVLSLLPAFCGFVVFFESVLR